MLVVGGDKLCKIRDMSEGCSGVLFGEGGGGVVMGEVGEGGGMIRYEMG
ncbi:hypothetical protein [Staphylococcus epidermidis]